MVNKNDSKTQLELQTALASVKVSVHDSSIRKRMGKNGIYGRGEGVLWRQMKAFIL